MYRKDKTKRIDRLIKRIESGERNIGNRIRQKYYLEIQGYSEGYDA